MPDPPLVKPGQSPPSSISYIEIILLATDGNKTQALRPSPMAASVALWIEEIREYIGTLHKKGLVANYQSLNSLLDCLQKERTDTCMQTC